MLQVQEQLQSMEHTELRQQIVEEARSWIGTPFKHQGRKKGVGVDCIGLVYEIAKKFNLADTDMRLAQQRGYSSYKVVPARGMMRNMCNDYLEKIRIAEAEAGDLFLIMFTRLEGHIAIYTGENTIIHALSSAKKCTEHSINGSVRKSITGAWRYPALCK